VGDARAWVDDTGPHVSVFVRPEVRKQGVGGHLLARVETLARQAGWAFPELQAEGPYGFYRSRSRWSVATRTPPMRTQPAS
jgi:GNAT superfamily N-acetyltransferase